MQTTGNRFRVPTYFFFAFPIGIILTLASALMASNHIALVMYYGYPYPWLGSIFIGSRFYWHCSPFNGAIRGWQVQLDKLVSDFMIWEAIAAAIMLTLGRIRYH
ncbi:MAG TPA: hypothetical protein VJZ32_12230 [Candidatus Bathyarchaeia archaeon]|nr:hypothetical protein [Candidatus Bathyarchaeia archaeon]